MTKPENLSDWIALMTAAKDKFGDLPVKFMSEGSSFSMEEFDELGDIKIEGGVSLLNDKMNDDSAFVIYRDY